MFLNKTIYKTKYYYSLQEIFNWSINQTLTTGSPMIYNYRGQAFINMVMDYIEKVYPQTNKYIYENFMEYNTDTHIYDVDDLIDELFNIVIRRYTDWIALVSEEDYNECHDYPNFNYFDYPEHRPFTMPVYKLWTRMLNLTYETFDRYSIILKAYRNNEAEILASIGDIEDVSTEAQAQNKFNDTPQLAQGTGDYTGDGYISNLNIANSEGSTSRASYGDVAERLASIRRNYANVMKEWADEFEAIFIPNVNYI